MGLVGHSRLCWCLLQSLVKGVVVGVVVGIGGVVIISVIIEVVSFGWGLDWIGLDWIGLIGVVRANS